MKKKSSLSKSVKNFRLSALIAFVITIIGLFAGASFIYGFGFFMIAIISLLTMVAVVEFIVR